MPAPPQGAPVPTVVYLLQGMQRDDAEAYIGTYNAWTTVKTLYVHGKGLIRVDFEGYHVEAGATINQFRVRLFDVRGTTELQTLTFTAPIGAYAWLSGTFTSVGMDAYIIQLQSINDKASGTGQYVRNLRVRTVE